jgi:hypothetical protein
MKQQEFMKRLPHIDRLRLLSGMVKPIAQSLKSASHSGSSATEESNRLPDSQIDSGRIDADSSLPQDSSGFFIVANQQQSSSQSVGLPPEASYADGQTPGRLFEYLRRAVLQQSAKDFSELPIRLQAIARMGGLIYTERLNFQPRVYHLLANGALLGVLDRKRGRFYLRKQFDPIDLTDLHAVIRPHDAEKPNSSMELMPVHDAVWLYGMHDPEALLDLPTEMGTYWLHLRKLPSVTPNLLLDRHLALIRLLLVRERLFDQLLRSTPKKDYTHLLRDLASLFLTRAIEPLPANVKLRGRLA